MGDRRWDLAVKAGPACEAEGREFRDTTLPPPRKRRCLRNLRRICLLLLLLHLHRNIRFHSYNRFTITVACHYFSLWRFIKTASLLITSQSQLSQFAITRYRGLETSLTVNLSFSAKLSFLHELNLQIKVYLDNRNNHHVVYPPEICL